MPRYETEQDLINEMEVIRRWLPAEPHYAAIKMGQFDLDFKIINSDNGSCIGYAEVKCYNTPHDRYPFQILSMIKVKKLLATDKQKTTYYICKFSDDVILYLPSYKLNGEIKLTSRKNQREGNTNDTEMCMYINKSNFKKLNR